MREAMVGDDIDSVAGILNGTCNFILSEMEKTGRSFADVLREAQALGYAEADPTMDVGGFDAGHKISILAALAFGCAPNFAAAEIEGISERRTAGHQAGQGSGLPHQAGRLGAAKHRSTAWR
jgi:homoserine dehydrogenase